MICQTCDGKRIALVSAKSSDLNFIELGERQMDGYLPHDMNIGAGDYVEFDYCLDCGQIQGEWPLPKTKLEKGEYD